MAFGEYSITIDSAKVDSTLTDFPVMIYLSGSSGTGSFDATQIFTDLGANFKKIKIKNSSDTELYCEIEMWDDTAEKAVLHVKVDSISSSADTELTLEWDSTWADNTTYIGETGDSAAESVWDSNFVAVYHMNQDPSSGAGCILDSTSNSNDGTPYGSMTSGDLVGADYGKAIDFDGVDDYINVSSDANGPLNPENITVETLLKLPSTPDGWDKVITLGRDSSYTLQSRHSTTLYPSLRIWGSSYAEAISTAYIYDNTYHLLTGTHDGVDVKIFTDGLLSCSPATLNGAISSDPGDFRISGDPLYASSNTKMLVAELRISNIARSAAWIKATNATLTDSLAAFSSADNEHIEDISLDLSAYYQARDNLAAILSATDGTAFQDLETFLKIYGQSIENMLAELAAYYQDRQDLAAVLKTLATGYNDLPTALQAMGLGRADLPAQLKTLAWAGKDLSTVLAAVTPLVFRDLHLSLSATDGTTINDLSTVLAAVKRAPQYRSVVAQRVRSVISEVI